MMLTRCESSIFAAILMTCMANFCNTGVIFIFINNLIYSLFRLVPMDPLPIQVGLDLDVLSTVLTVDSPYLELSRGREICSR